MAISSFKVVCFAMLLTFSLASSSSSSPIERFKGYLRINTAHPDPDYEASTAFLLGQASEIGLEAQKLVFEDSNPVVVISWLGSNPSLPSILLNSHSDVVAAEPQKWKHHPFADNIHLEWGYEDEDGNIYGRGSQDTKSTGMQYLEAIRDLKSSGYTPLRSVHVSFVPDEEIGGSNGMGKLVSSPEYSNLNVAVNLDEGLASENEFYRVFYGERAVWKLVIKARGRPGHGSKLFDGSAMENLRESLREIYEFRESQFGMLKDGVKSDGEVVAINNVFLRAGIPANEGFVMNVQPSEAEAGFDIRVPPSVDMEELEKTYIQIKWAPASRNLTYTLTDYEPRGSPKGGKRLPTSASDMNPWWELLKEAVSKAGGKLGPPMIRPSATDSRFIRHLGTPAFGFSPMAHTTSLLHSHNEFLNAQEYLKGIKVYCEVIKAFSGHVDFADS